MIKSNYQIRSLTTEDFLSLYWSICFIDASMLMFETRIVQVKWRIKTRKLKE